MAIVVCMSNMDAADKLAGSRREVHDLLSQASGTDPAILDSIRSQIGPEEQWDLSTPGQVRKLIAQHTRLVG